MSNTHPKALEAQARKQEAQDHRLRMLIRRAVLADKHKLKFVHIPGAPQAGFRDMTVAYTVDRRNVLEIATAICHPNDRFDKKTGEFYAADSFNDGRRVTLHMPSLYAQHGGPSSFILSRFAG